MSRSFRKKPIIGVDNAKNDKSLKKFTNKRIRQSFNQSDINNMDNQRDNIHIVSNRTGAKDGKCYFGNLYYYDYNTYCKFLRK